MARRPSPWWSSRNMTNVFLPRTNHVGEPWLNRSVASGRSRQIRRTWARASAAVASEYMARSVARASRRRPHPDHRAPRLGRRHDAVGLDPRQPVAEAAGDGGAAHVGLVAMDL